MLQENDGSDATTTREVCTSSLKAASTHQIMPELSSALSANMAQRALDSRGYSASSWLRAANFSLCSLHGHRSLA